MHIHKETEILNPMFVARLDNGITLLVFDGYAIGSDSKRYYHIGREDEDGIMQTVGWSCDVDGEMTI